MAVIETRNACRRSGGRLQGDPMETQTPVAPVAGFEFTPETPVALTDRAVGKVREAIEQQKLDGHWLRIAVVGGGCSGFNYDLDLVREAKESDYTYELAGLRMAIDKMSARFLDGTVID